VTRPRLLDLFCGAGGAAMGYHRAGFDVVGVDNRPQPRYPFTFHQADAMTFPLDGYDAIHASPPCQDHMRWRAPGQAQHQTAWMLAGIRRRLEDWGGVWVIENVPGAPMRTDFKLCGCLFGLAIPGKAQLVRERWFETSWRGFELRAPCQHLDPAVSVTGHDLMSYQRGTMTRDERNDLRRRLLGIDWTDPRDELGQAIPPAYTEHIGAQLLQHLTAVAS